MLVDSGSAVASVTYIVVAVVGGEKVKDVGVGTEHHSHGCSLHHRVGS